ncbi:MAG: adenosylcobinamide-GDP ribazoletransferase [Alphaproteobacteria bacterium]|nr:adenosylcobinamide-GDP ribazoletransferase [Alphaproteobacteria bacterium]
MNWITLYYLFMTMNILIKFIRNRFHEFCAGLGFFTRLPVSWVDCGYFTARAYWSVPLVGVAIGAISGGVYWFAADGLGLVRPLAALLGLLAGIVVTGALHEDGLADCADGLGIRGSPAEVLALMRQPSVGVFGTIAVLISLLWRTAAVATLAPVTGLVALILTHGMARGLMVAVARTRRASPTGLHHHSGRPSRGMVLVTLLQGLGLAAVGLWLGLWSAAHLLVLAIILVAANLYILRLARARIGGINGDCLGACEQVNELVILGVMAQGLGSAGGFPT